MWLASTSHHTQSTLGGPFCKLFQAFTVININVAVPCEHPSDKAEDAVLRGSCVSPRLRGGWGES
jgi:hypothetical protein